MSPPLSPIELVLAALPPDELTALKAKLDRQLAQSRERVAFLEFQETQFAAVAAMQAANKDAR